MLLWFAPDLLVIHVAGAAQECGPAFGVQLQWSDAVSSVPLTRDLRGQNLQTVPRRQTWKKQHRSVQHIKTMKVFDFKFLIWEQLTSSKFVQLPCEIASKTFGFMCLKESIY